MDVGAMETIYKSSTNIEKTLWRKVCVKTYV